MYFVGNVHGETLVWSIKVLYCILPLKHSAQTRHLLITPDAEAAWAQCASTPIDPDSRSPCPPHLLPLPSIVHEITRNKKLQLEIAKQRVQKWCCIYSMK